MTQLAYLPFDLADELAALAIKHHAQDILDDMPAMNEPDLIGALNYLRRIDMEWNWNGS